MNRLSFLIATLMTCGVAFAQPATEEYYPVQAPEAPWQYQATLTGGYSNFIFDHANNGATYNHSGAYIDIDAAFNLPKVYPFVFSAGLSASGYWKSFQFDFQDLYSEVNMVSFEGRAELPLAFNQREGLFFTPRIGVGGLFSNYYVQTPFGGSLNHNGAAFEFRPGAQVGYRFLDGKAAAGLDGSYMVAWGDFGDFGTFAQELRIGLFFSYRF